MNVLLHICCAACAIEPFEQLKGGGHRVTGCFFNPNVHPLIEFRRRLKAVKVLQERLPMPVIYEEDYGLVAYLDAVDWHSPARCEGCYRLRLGHTARLAAERGFDAFTTTLLSSTHQDHELIRRLGQEAAEQSGVEFLYADWRGLAERGHERARGMHLYMQAYCGCIFSERERYKDSTLHLYRGAGPLSQGDEEAEAGR
jgi:predicted adenine nucleotide alpha hydrolase (AANH) superfamily ATPase